MTRGFMTLKNKKIVLITGAAGGLGTALTDIFLKNDYRVIATDVGLNMPDIFQRHKNLTYFKMDVTSESDTETAAVRITEEFGQLDLMISNAAVVDYFPISEAGSTQLKKIFEVNVFGLANLTKYFLPLLIKSSGRLIVISSESYKVPAPFQPYSVSKQALENMYNSIRLELMTKGVKTVLVRPGAIQTGILQDTLDFDYTLSNSVFVEEFKRFGKSISKYVGKAVAPENVAKVVFKAATASAPKRTYKINHNFLVSLLSVLPGKWKETLIKKSLK